MKRKIPFLATLAVLLLLSAGSSSAATLFVDGAALGCPTIDFIDIPSAVAAAAPGDTIIVCPGVYSGQIVINKPITLQALNKASDLGGDLCGAAACPPGSPNSVIHGGFLGPVPPPPPTEVVHILSDGVVIDGFEITNPQGLTNPPGSPAAFSLVTVGTFTPGPGGILTGIQIVDNVMHRVGYPPFAYNTLGAQAINWNNASGLIEGNTIFNIITTDVDDSLGRGIWLSTGPLPGPGDLPSDIPEQDVVIRDNRIFDMDRYGIGVARMNKVLMEGNTLFNTGWGSVFLKHSHDITFHDNAVLGYEVAGFWNNIDVYGPEPSTMLTVTENAFFNNAIDPGAAGTAVALSPANHSTVTDNIIVDLGTGADMRYAVVLGLETPSLTIPVEGNFVCRNYDAPLDQGGQLITGPEIFVATGSTGNFFPGGELVAGNGGCLIGVNIDVRPGSTTNQVNSNAKQLVPIAILSDEGLDACTGVDPDVQARGASPVKAKCGDVDGDGDQDLEVFFRARSFEKPTIEECNDPEATIELTGFTLTGTPIVGSDYVDWLGPDCK